MSLILVAPPAYDEIFDKPRKSTETSGKTVKLRNTTPVHVVIQNNYYEDDRNLWEKLHEWFELSGGLRITIF